MAARTSLRVKSFMQHYSVKAENFSQDSENRIHSDDIAQKYGFSGALVPGVAIYGHLTYPLVEEFGQLWLDQACNQVRLFKPTYHGDILTFTYIDGPEKQTVNCDNQNGVRIATLTSEFNSAPETPDLTSLAPPYKNPDRTEIQWHNVVPYQAFTPWTCELTPADNERYVTEVKDPHSLYKTGAIHPHLLLSLANTALMNEYKMPTWLHVGSETRHHAGLYEGDTVTVKSVPLKKWQNKGHHFIQIWVTYWRDNVMTTEIRHTAIFKLAA